MQPGEGQFHLRLHPGRPHHPASVRLPGQVIKQHRLAHARVAVQHEHPALAGPDRAEEAVEPAAFTVPAGRLRRAPRRCAAE